MSNEKIEKAVSNLLRGNDIESACLIMQEVIWNNLVINGGRVNIVKIAMRQILNFIEEYKDRSYLDIIREKVQIKEKNKELEQENNKQNKIINEMAEQLSGLVIYDIEENQPLILEDKEEVKQYFEKKVE